MESSASAGRVASAVLDPRRWWALALLCGAFFMVLLDGTITIVALPSIGAGLRFSEQGLQWVLSAYALTFGGLLLLGGRAADLLGRRRVFMAGFRPAAATRSPGHASQPSGRQSKGPQKDVSQVYSYLASQAAKDRQREMLDEASQQRLGHQARAPARASRRAERAQRRVRGAVRRVLRLRAEPEQ